MPVPGAVYPERSERVYLPLRNAENSSETGAGKLPLAHFFSYVDFFNRLRSPSVPTPAAVALVSKRVGFGEACAT